MPHLSQNKKTSFRFDIAGIPQKFSGGCFLYHCIHFVQISFLTQMYKRFTDNCHKMPFHFVFIDREKYLVLAMQKPQGYFSAEFFYETRQCQLNRRAVITLHCIKAEVFLIKNKINNQKTNSA
jgi:hypothetical protein